MTINDPPRKSREKQDEETPRVEKENLQRILDSMEDGAYVVDEKYDIQYVNPAIVREFGPPSGKKCFEYFHGRQSMCPWCKNPELLAGGSVRWQWTSPKNGKIYDMVATALASPAGGVWKVEVFRDITEMKRAESEILQRVEELRIANEELQRFNRAAVDRELRMVELKKQVNELCVRLGEPPPYKLEFEKE